MTDCRASSSSGQSLNSVTDDEANSESADIAPAAFASPLFGIAALASPPRTSHLRKPPHGPKTA